MRKIFIGFFILIFLFCSDKTKKTKIVAKYKNINIYLCEFEKYYSKNFLINYKYDNLQARKDFAQRLIEQTLIAQIGLQKNIDTISSVVRNIDIEYGKLLREKYLKSIILDTLAPPDKKRLNQILKRYSKIFYIRRIISFDSLLIFKKKDSIINNFDFYFAKFNKIKHRGIYAEYLKLPWKNIEYEVEDVFYKLQPGEVSGFINSTYGYYIFKVDSIKDSINIAQTDKYKTIEDIKKIDMFKRFDYYALKKIREILLENKPVIFLKKARLLWSEYKNDIEKNLEISIDKNSRFHQIIAFVDNGRLTLYFDEFINRLSTIPKYYQNITGLNRAIQLALRDKILEMKAREYGIEESPCFSVLKNRVKYEQIYFYMLFSTGKTDFKWAHNLLLPKDYKKEDIIYFEDNLKNLFINNRLF